ncbi:MAG: glutathione S-transferase [Bacteriovoracaceae bacterium]|jgi:glutathione S-transferase
MAKEPVMLRAVVTKDKPADMLELSPKGTVPILLLLDGTLIDESLDIMIWALNKNDPDDLLFGEQPEVYSKMIELIKKGDGEFRTNLSAYKHHKRYHLEDEVKLRTLCEEYILELENLLSDKDFFMGDRLSLADLALLPFVRQFANVDKKWFRSAPYPRLTLWLKKQMQSLLFTKTMRKYPLWLETKEQYLFSWDSKTNL